MLQHGFVILCLAGYLNLGVPANAAEGVNASQPNIVLIISDDQTYTDFGFMGHSQVQTPNLDKLASQSLQYTHGYVPTSVCRPSLVTLLTGLYPHQNDVYFNHPPPGFGKLTRSPEIDKQRYDELRQRAAEQIHAVPTLPGLLAQLRGYRCFQTGKYWEGHWRNARFTEGMTLAEPSKARHGNKVLQNGDVVAHGNGDAGLAIGRETMQPIKDFLGDLHGAPFFLWYAPFLPHAPHDSPERFRELYKNNPDVQPHQVPYFAAISEFDATIGQLMQILEENQKTENTIFVFVVDNGWEPDRDKYRTQTQEWDHTLQSKRSPFEPGLRTPILIRWDGKVAPQKLDRLVSSIDIVPTLLHAAGVKTEGLSLPGGDLLSPEFQKVSQADSMVYGEIYPGDASELGHPETDVAYRWVRKGPYKLIVPHSHNGQVPWGKYLKQDALYNVVDDPRETKNLIGNVKLSGIVQELRTALDAWWSP